MLGTQTHLEQALQIDFGSDPDSVATRLLTDATGIVEAFLGYPVASAEYTETHDGGTEFVVLDKPPIGDVTSVTEMGTVLTEGDDYDVLGSGVLRRLYGGTLLSKWARYPGAVVVVYDGGLDPVPDAVTRIAVDIAARMFKAGAAFAATSSVAPDLAVSREAIGEYEVSYRDPRGLEPEGGWLQPHEKAILARWIRQWMS